jgi:putative copper export protein
LSGWDAAAVAVKAIAYAATLSAAGAVFFLAYAEALIPGAQRIRIVRLVRLSSALALLAGGAQILVTAGSMSGEAADMMSLPLLSMVSQSGLGRAVAVRALGLVLATLGISGRRRPSAVGVAGAVIAATSFAWTGHTHALLPHAPPILLLGVHLCAVAFWLGALAPLLLVLRSGDAPAAGAAVGRFGAVALYVVGALLAAGLGLAWLLLGDVTRLWSSAYGRWLACKLVVVACLLGCAAVNKWRLTPRLRAGEFSARQSLRTSIRMEMLLGAAILGVTAALTTQQGPPALE